ncbi:sodium/proton antiporter, CPA1 family [Kushneria avicenniae]|uniref:Sodium/proton antiporter, CPA1 family n=1 Tax=Kushneria avicenniae TaxID=402385 RepID=A0A1I1LRK1_9GAMM|nr:Na+/H+ antiporter [Kushneria avicenniae]SFC75142.1 sodium/proton antiporter, CPA1 family [Kushneria avicenniae]
MHIVLLALALILVAAGSGILARFMPRIPLPILQIVIGALLAWLNTPLDINLEPETFMLLFVPPLLFADAWQFPQRELTSLRHPIIALAVGLVLFTVVGAGFLIHWLLPNLPLAVCFALAAILSPTDAVAVSAISGQLGIPPRLMHILEGESLMNDASALVSLKFAVAAAMTGAFSFGQVSLQFALITFIGISVGIALAFVFSTIRRKLIDKRGTESSTEILLVMLMIPFAAYLIAEHFDGSGIMAAVAAGITINRTELKRYAQTRTRMQMNQFWEILTFLLNAMVFLLLGLQLPDIIGGAIQVSLNNVRSFSSLELVFHVVVISLSLMLLRLFWIMGAVYLSRLSSRRRRSAHVPLSGGVMAVGTLAGIRGTITLAAALSLPLALPSGEPFPGRDLVIFLATGVILFTLLVGSVALPLLLRRMDKPDDSWRDEEVRVARHAASSAAIETIEAWHANAVETRDSQLERSVLTDTSARLISYYRNLMTIDDRHSSSERHELDQRFSREMRLAALRAERREYYRLRSEHQIDDDTLRRLVRELDLVEMALTSRPRR